MFRLHVAHNFIPSIKVIGTAFGTQLSVRDHGTDTEVPRASTSFHAEYIQILQYFIIAVK